MARPERNTVDYFPFLCDEGKKMFCIEETYGNDGFSTFIKILRELAKTEYHYLDLSKKTTMMFLSAKCKVSKDILESIINDLVDLEKFDSDLWVNHNIVWCQDFIDSIQDAYKKRNNNCITYEGLLLLLISLGMRKQPKSKTTVPVKPQSILKDTKLDDIKVNEMPEYFDFESYAIDKCTELKLDLDLIKLRLKYDSWKENDWATLGDKPRKIKNWKSTLNNSLIYLQKEKSSEKKENQNEQYSKTQIARNKFLQESDEIERGDYS